MEEFFKNIGVAGFWFFFIKGCLWLVLFALVYFGIIDKQKAKAFKSKITFWKRSNKKAKE
ncbi:MAG: hypothetical protein CR982_02635 [Candidatus Cloacimonadota bacterium]|nr:MAG: hypothetical protein CR982_02635 [Candidatus Cloacimonadota bacterium]PIE79326.1 MAG: hypothetical protein CSA15_03490 [Candidatus Delongbacteria bacterium]